MNKEQNNTNNTTIKTKIMVTACGGGGINASIFLKDELKDLHPEIKMSIRAIDTTVKNEALNNDIELYKVSSPDVTDKDLDGSGGERGRHDKAINIAVKKYFDEKSIHIKEKDMIHIVIFTGSGGSGNPIGTMLVNYMIEKELLVLPVVIADNEDCLKSSNTIKTFKLLNSLAVKFKIPQPMFYVDNSKHRSLTEANKEIAVFLMILYIFLSDNKELDYEDMKNFIAPRRYKTKRIKEAIKPGLYLTNLYSKKTESNIVLGRTLVSSIEELKTYKSENKALHDKIGIINPIFKERLKDRLPLLLVLTANNLQVLINELESNIKEIENKINSIENNLNLETLDDDEDELDFDNW